MPLWAKSLVFVCVMSNLFPVIIGLVYRRKLTTNMRILLLLYLLLIGAEMVLNYQAEMAVNNLWLIHLMTICEYVLLTIVFVYWQKNRIAKQVIRMTIPIYLVVWVMAKYSFEDFHTYDNFTASFASLLLTGITLYTLYTYLKIYSNSLTHAPWFWVSVGVLVYQAGNFFVFALSTTVFVWGLHNVLNIVANIIIAGGFLSLRHSSIGGF